jgi:predicted transcriptional regulator
MKYKRIPYMGEKNKNIRKLSPKEEAIMGYFWQCGPLFVRQVVEMMPDPKPHFNTVSTFVRGLEAKGWLAHEQIGNSYRYHAVADAGEYRDKSLRGLIDRFFGRSYISFVSSLVREEKISTTELRELIEQIEAQKEKEKEG